MDVSKSYFSFIEELKNEINSARIKASISVNKELILLYWNIVLKIIQKKESEHWGAKIIEKISQSLKHEFPEMKGLSPRNLIYMQTFAKEFPEFEFTQQAVAQIPWGHVTLLLDKLKDTKERLWYADKTFENGWSRNVLEHQIASSLYAR